MGRGGGGALALQLRTLGSSHTGRGVDEARRGYPLPAPSTGRAAGIHAAGDVSAKARRGEKAKGPQVKCPGCGALVLIREDARTLQEVVDERMRAALARFGKDVSAAALSLGISRSSVYRWMARKGVKP
jgi:DNA-binding NtrC family response regulator